MKRIPPIPPSLVERARQLVNPLVLPKPPPVVDPGPEKLAMEEHHRRADEDAVRRALHYLMPRTKERTIDRVTVYALCERYGMHPNFPTRQQQEARARQRVNIATAISRLHAEGELEVLGDGTLILADYVATHEPAHPRRQTIPPYRQPNHADRTHPPVRGAEADPT